VEIAAKIGGGDDVASAAHHDDIFEYLTARVRGDDTTHSLGSVDE